MSKPSSTSIEATIEKALGWSTNQQHPDGHWVGLLETNSTMEAEWILGMHFLGVQDDPKKEGVLKCIRTMQRPDGSWAVYHGADGGDLNATVECYAALRCSGASASEPALVRAREWIFNNGGVQSTRVFTKIWLALIGEWPWDGTPSLPPEITIWPGQLSLATTTAGPLTLTEASAQMALSTGASRPNTAAMLPGCCSPANFIRRPRSRTNFTPSSKVNAPAAHKALNSPKLCPATNCGGG